MRALGIPGYQVWGLLGEGGMSEVWLAKHEVLAAPVIIKTLRRALRESDGHGAAARILAEARLMARVSSPRIVRALDAGQLEADGVTTPFLVQEYVDGLDLAELDRRRRASLGVGLPLWFVVSLGGTRIREVTIWLDSEAKRRVYRDVAEEVLGFEAGHLGPLDVGLPDSATPTDAEGATCLDPGIANQ